MGRTGLILKGLQSSRSEKAERENEYRDYLHRHIQGVQDAYGDYMAPLLNSSEVSDSFKKAIRSVGPRLVYHDNSKWGPPEFDGYRLHFYPTPEESSNPKQQEISDSLYEGAKRHHYENNPHHMEHWLGRNKAMPRMYVVEMLCDWLSFSYVKNDDTRKWFESEAGKEREMMETALSEESRGFVYWFMGGLQYA